MRILLDEDVPVQLRFDFPSEFEVETVIYRGWDTLDNGDLWEVAQHEFDAIITLDQNVEEQQNVDRYDLVVVVMQAGYGRRPELRPLIPEVINELMTRSPSTKVINVQVMNGS